MVLIALKVVPSDDFVLKIVWVFLCACMSFCLGFLLLFYQKIILGKPSECQRDRAQNGKPDLVVCEQQRRRPACVYEQADQRLCYLPSDKY